MTYFANGILTRLQKTFQDDDITLDAQSNYIIADNSQNQTEEKIRQIVELSGFCPLISQYKINKNFAFTLIPYKMPDFFNRIFATDNHEQKLISIDHVMNKIFVADQTRQIGQIDTEIRNCMLNSSISLQQIECVLREKNCFSVLIARKNPSLCNGDIVINSLQGGTKTYCLSISTRPFLTAFSELLEESISYNENFQKLNDTGWLIYRKK